MSWWNYPTASGSSQALSGVDPGGGQRQFLALLIFLFLAPFCLNAPVFRFPPFGFSFQPFSVSAFCFVTPSAVSLRRTGKRKSQGGGRGGQRPLLALPVFQFLALWFLNATGFRFPHSGFRFQRFSFLLRHQVLESNSARARSLLLGFSIQYPTSISSGIRARSGKLVAKVKHAIPAQERPEAAQPMV